MVEAKKLAFADRETYVADPDFLDIPMEGMLSQDVRLGARFPHRQAKGQPECGPRQPLSLPGRPCPTAFPKEDPRPRKRRGHHLLRRRGQVGQCREPAAEPAERIRFGGGGGRVRGFCSTIA